MRVLNLRKEIKVQVNFSLEKSRKKELEVLAKDNKATIGEVINYLIEDSLSRLKSTEDTALEPVPEIELEEVEEKPKTTRKATKR